MGGGRHCKHISQSGIQQAVKHRMQSVMFKYSTHTQPYKKNYSTCCVFVSRSFVTGLQKVYWLVCCKTGCEYWCMAFKRWGLNKPFKGWGLNKPFKGVQLHLDPCLVVKSCLYSRTQPYHIGAHTHSTHTAHTPHTQHTHIKHTTYTCTNTHAHTHVHTHMHTHLATFEYHCYQIHTQ